MKTRNGNGMYKGKKILLQDKKYRLRNMSLVISKSWHSSESFFFFKYMEQRKSSIGSCLVEQQPLINFRSCFALYSQGILSKLKKK